MKRLPILVVESRYVHHRGANYRTGCSACAVYEHNRCMESTHLPNAESMLCLTGPGRPYGGHYKFSQHKISVSRNKREGNMLLSNATQKQYVAGWGVAEYLYPATRRRAGQTGWSERELTYDQAYNTAYPPRERQAKHAQWGRGRG